MSISADLLEIKRTAEAIRLMATHGHLGDLPARVLESVSRIEQCLERAHRELRRLDGELGHGEQLALGHERAGPVL